MDRKPVLDNPKRVSKCHKCKDAFTTFNKQYHCMACGHVFCNSCRTQKLSIPRYVKYYGSEPVPVCTDCYLKEKSALVKTPSKNSRTSAQIKPTTTKDSKVVSLEDQLEKASIDDGVDLFQTPQKSAALNKFNKSNTMVYLPTSVRKDVLKNDVINSIFDDDIFSSTPATSSSKSTTSTPVKRAQPTQTSGGSPLNDTDELFGNIAAKSQSVPVIQRNKKVQDPAQSIFDTPSTVYTAASTEISEKNQASLPAYSAFGVSPQPSHHKTHSIQDSQDDVPLEELPDFIISRVDSTPSSPLVPPKITEEPIQKPSSTLSKQSSITKTESVQQHPTPVKEPIKQPSIPLQEPVKQPEKQSTPSSSLPSPCSSSVFIPPRDSGVPETEKSRMMQEKLFLRYVNAYLGQRQFFIQQFVSDFTNGVFFIMLVECVSRIPLPDDLNVNCSINPSNRDECYRNFYYALLHLKQISKTMPPVSIDNILDGNLSAILDLVWYLAYRFEIEPISYNGDSGIGGILIWTKEISSVYAADFYDFKKSFEDGLLFNFILHRFAPHMIDLGSLLTTMSPFERLESAFTLANGVYGIPTILDPIDMLENPDDVCVIIYLAFLHNYVR